MFQPAVRRACPNCGKPAQADWKTCPHCGQTL
ncbi:MAG: zinc ribbon domain-containing protein [Chloroflexota bacterium]